MPADFQYISFVNTALFGGATVNVQVGGAAISAGTNEQSTGVVNFSNSNGVTFGLDSVGVMTASVAAAASAGVGAVIASGSTATSGTVSFGNSNGVSFGMDSNQRVTASIAAYLTTAANSTHSHGGVSLALTNITGSTSSASNGLTLSLVGGAGTAGGGAAISASGGSQNTGTVVFGDANGVVFGYSAGTITASGMVSDLTVAGNLSFSQGTGASSTAFTMIGMAPAMAISGSTFTSGTVYFEGSNSLSVSHVTGSAGVQTLRLIPAMSLISAGSGIGISSTGGTIIIYTV